VGRFEVIVQSNRLTLQRACPAMPIAPFSEFARVAAHLKARRSQILTQWHHKVADDPGVGAASSLARAQFIDHIPRILDG
jgi:hypothetical protein